MRILKETSDKAKKIRELEQYLLDNNMEISHRYDGIVLSLDGENFIFKTEGRQEFELPIPVEPSFICPLESHLRGE
jgi:hypothetical protein